MATFLLLDDDPQILEAMSIMLEGAGHSVRTAADGREGLTSFLEARPDLVVSDIIMPHQEGIETIRAIRAIDPNVPIIAISGGGLFRTVDFLKLSVQLGATAALAKPFAAADLLGLVTRLLQTAPAAAAPNTATSR